VVIVLGAIRASRILVGPQSLINDEGDRRGQKGTKHIRV